jgi:hypothetical protein
MSREINGNRDDFRGKVGSAEISLKRSLRYQETDENGKIRNLRGLTF